MPKTHPQRDEALELPKMAHFVPQLEKLCASSKSGQGEGTSPDYGLQVCNMNAIATHTLRGCSRPERILVKFRHFFPEVHSLGRCCKTPQPIYHSIALDRAECPPNHHKTDCSSEKKVMAKKQNSTFFKLTFSTFRQ